MRAWRTWWRLVAMAGLLLVAPSWSRAGEADIGVAAGADLFARHCTACHGSGGGGDGEAAARLSTPPAVLTDGQVKFRSTPQQEPPLLSDFERTIREGSRGTAMVEWGSFLDGAAIARLAGHVLELEGWADEGQAPRSAPDRDGSAGTPPGASGSGAELYDRLGCAQCHGADRRGAGPAAARLADPSGRPVPMPDLELLPYKRGSDPVETAKTLLYGMDGTPMASFEGAVTKQQALELARWLVESATVERRGWIGEEHLGYMIEMHLAGRGMGGRHGMGPHHGRGGRHGMHGSGPAAGAALVAPPAGAGQLNPSR